jgi:hypothetical protein
MSQSLKGIPCSRACREATSKHWKGRKRGPMSEETKQRVSAAKMGTPSHPWTEQSREKLSKSLKGRKPGEKTKQRMREARQRALARGQRSRVKMITYEGKTLCIKDWAVLTGIDRTTLSYRLGRGGWSIADALTTPTRS